MATTNNPWLDTNVQQAIDAGRSADEIFVGKCPRCGGFSYWSEMPTFTCRLCGWHADGLGVDSMIETEQICLLEVLMEVGTGFEGF